MSTNRFQNAHLIPAFPWGRLSYSFTGSFFFIPQGDLAQILLEEFSDSWVSLHSAPARWLDEPEANCCITGAGREHLKLKVLEGLCCSIAIENFVTCWRCPLVTKFQELFTYLEVLGQLRMVIQRSICRNSYKLTFYSGSVGSPYCVFGCQLQVVVFLSAPSLIQFCTDVILNVQIFRCVWTENLAEVGLRALWNKQVPREFVLPCIVW